jgi:hypothetical protein
MKLMAIIGLLIVMVIPILVIYVGFQLMGPVMSIETLPIFFIVLCVVAGIIALMGMLIFERNQQ